MSEGQSTRTAEFLARLDIVEQRLAAHAAGDASRAAGRLTAPDRGTGEQWQWGQVWAHLAEFIPYWLAQSCTVIGSYAGEPVPFGRVKSDSERVAAIERDRGVAMEELWQRLHGHIAELRVFLRELPDSAWQARGVHQTLGVMPLPHIVDEFLVGHLEQHADQLDSLADG
jgi:hypothetical protein